MKAKNDRKGATDKKAYVRPRVTILQPESDEARKIADALGAKKAKSAKAKSGS